MARDTITKSEVFEAYTGAKAYAKRALPTLDTILKVASLITQLRPAVEESDQVRLMMAAKAEHVTNPMTGQDVVKSPDLFNAEMFKAMRLPVSITRVRVRLTRSDRNWRTRSLNWGRSSSMSLSHDHLFDHAKKRIRWEWYHWPLPVYVSRLRGDTPVGEVHRSLERRDDPRLRRRLHCHRRGGAGRRNDHADRGAS